MEQENSTADNSNTIKKRVRGDSDEFDLVTPESKRVCGEPPVTESTSPTTGGDMGLTHAAKISIPDDILDILGDTETLPENQDLDSVIRSFEEEILHSSHPKTHQTVTGESPPELGYLLAASDDQLGLPPAGSTSSEEAQDELRHLQTGSSVENVSINGIEGFGNDLVSYDSFEFGVGDENGEFGTILDGLFEESESGDFSDFAWRPETLPAL